MSTKAILQDTGERMIPEFHKGRDMYGAHVGRYEAGLSIVKSKVVLDIACGSGYGTKIISGHAKKVYGVDVDKDTIEYAKQNYSAKNIEYLLGDGTKIPLKNASVDVVISYETIEHIEDYKKFMNEVKRVLKPDGLFILSTPNDSEYIEGNHYHIHEFKYSELKKLVSNYFKNQVNYFQTMWMYSAIVPEAMHTCEWRALTDTISTVPLNPDQCIYFYILCSNRQITETVEPIGVLGEHFRHKKIEEENKKRRAVIESYNERDENRKKTIKEQSIQIDKLRKIADSQNTQLLTLQKSKAYMLGKALLSPTYIAKKVVNKIKRR